MDKTKWPWLRRLKRDKARIGFANLSDDNLFAGVRALRQPRKVDLGGMNVDNRFRA